MTALCCVDFHQSLDIDNKVEGLRHGRAHISKR